MGQAHSILVVEDELDLAQMICAQLTRAGYQCRKLHDGALVSGEVRRQPPDLILLDRMLPKMSGDEVMSGLKRDPRTAHIPIIMLTARAEESDALVGFALGADDYVTKPFSLKVLTARIAAVLRRRDVSSSDDPVLTVGPVVLDRGRHEALVANVAVSLTVTEFRILAALMNARGRVLERAAVIDSVLGSGAAVTNRTVDVHVAALRRKLGRCSGWIQTVRGVGYAFREPECERSRA